MAKTILIVDDSASLRQAVSIALKREGYEVMEACDGKDGLSKLTGQKVHLIISDVNMPNMDGLTMVSQIKQMPAYKFTPVIMLTTEAGEEMKAKGKAAGAKAWVVKPFKPEQMITAVSKLVAA
ncbi:response regulator [Endothiovibrio diazotrophicus]